MKEEEIEKGDCGPPIRKVSVFYSRLRGDWVPLGSSPTKSQKKKDITV